MALCVKSLLISLFIFADTVLCAAGVKITFLDVGVGDAAVIQIDQAGEPFTIIVDAGNTDSDLKDNLPALLAQDPTVELVVLSHPHDDHTGALPWLINSRYAVKRVWWTAEIYSEPNYNLFRISCLAKGIPIERPAETNISFPGFSNFQLRVFSNGQKFSGTSGSAINNNSLVFQLIFEPSPQVKTTVLFTGDIWREEGQRLVEQYGDGLRSDVIRVPHHGSTRLFEEFAGKVGARYAIVSASATNKTYMLPRKEALDLYAKFGSIYCTCGDENKKKNITVTISDSREISVSRDQAPYFAWIQDENGKLKKIVVK
jgi:competence protein ComEC